ncbi:hypothetical protein GGH96_004299 [Coemansia sp. RSA 1972]|nr:hypothetical protein GGH96_004299 [Coemansia sp. RSA 1972]
MWQPPQLLSVPSVPSQQQQQKQADCAYISELLQATLQGMAGWCVLVNLGCRDLLYMLHEKSTIEKKDVYRYTRNQQHRKTKQARYCKILQDEKKTDVADITVLECKLKADSFIKPDIKLFEVYLTAQLQERFSKDAVFILSNWGVPMAKFHEPIRGKGWWILLKCAGFDMYLIDEYLTSKTCPICEERISTFYNVKNL